MKKFILAVLVVVAVNGAFVAGAITGGRLVGDLYENCGRQIDPSAAFARVLDEFEPVQEAPEEEGDLTDVIL